MCIDEEDEKEEKKWEAKMKVQWQKNEQERISMNNKILQIPNYLSDEEKVAYESIANQINKSIKYRLTESDIELIWQYCQLKVMRDRAWKKWNENPERYTRIVTGICSDGKTPKVMVKENEHYKTLLDCNKHLEKILKDLRLTPEIRSKR